MPIRWDSLLVRHLARELDAVLSGQRVRALRLDGASRDVVLFMKASSLAWRLHPRRGQLRLGEAHEPSSSDLRLRARIRSVTAPEDDRIVRLELIPERGPGPLAIVVELIANRWNAVVIGGPEATVRHVLARRERPRMLAVGQPYAMPGRTGRAGALDPLDLAEWRRLLAEVAPEDRTAALVRSVAWTSPLNTPTILGSAASTVGGEALDAAYGRWRQIASSDVSEPVLVEVEGDLQPYPIPLTGVTQRPCSTLLEAFDGAWSAAEQAGEAVLSIDLGPELLGMLEDAVRHHERRLARLVAELAAVEDPDALRRVGDLILARFDDVVPGRSEVTLTSFEGEPVRVELDPAIPPHENANRYYARAARSARARARLPRLVDEARRSLDRLERLGERALAGEVDAEELREALPERPLRQRGATSAERLPFRSYRSSGGLEIRVGRGARHNDDLTFRHSSPGDVWLHARHAAGAHVVLRWTGDGPPPARDLAEAATLAALHSKARTSASVPVDWTFRKYVRKPRGSPPGRVVIDRARTLFVRPDEALVDALAEPAPDDEIP